MVATASTMLPLGTEAPPFRLTHCVDQSEVALGTGNGRESLVAFVCNHCPFVIHLLDHLAPYFNQLLEDGASVYLISSNDVDKYPADSPEKMKALATENDFRFPYLFDPDQSVAKAYRAACTPDFFLFDGQNRLYYRGRYDESRPGNGLAVTGQDLKHAMTSLLAGEPPPEGQHPSMGCNIKWKPGNEPGYFKS